MNSRRTGAGRMPASAPATPTRVRGRFSHSSVTALACLPLLALALANKRSAPWEPWVGRSETKR
jgi:hypothetical protein